VKRSSDTYHSGGGTASTSRRVAGHVRQVAGVKSPQLGNERDVLVYLPPSYRTSGRHYPVVYMHDGQNLFDPETSFAGEWGVDDTMERLAQEGLEAIVVAIPNMGGTRCDEYSPWIDARAGGGRGDEYLAFVVDTLKPRIDRRFRTRRERDATGIMGSSMGGLISLYGFLRYPSVFGFCGGMSPSLWFADRAIFGVVAGVQRWYGRIYLDVGTAEGARHVHNTQQMFRLLQRRCPYPRDQIWCLIEPDAPHNEAAWAARFETAIRFLLPGRKGETHW
jgi:predicted alpha/beta superfamily hydrolase